MLHDDSSQIAKLLMDGCNMGIQSIGKFSMSMKRRLLRAVRCKEAAPYGRTADERIETILIKTG